MNEAEFQRKGRRCLEENTRFRTMITALLAGGFHRRGSYDLRMCMEREWRFEQVAEALERKGKPLDFSTREAETNARQRYDDTMEILEPYHGRLVRALSTAGFDDQACGRSLVSCLQHGYGFKRFKAAMAGWDRPLEFGGEDHEWKVGNAYKAALTHGKSMVDLYAQRWR